MRICKHVYIHIQPFNVGRKNPKIQKVPESQKLTGPPSINAEAGGGGRGGGGELSAQVLGIQPSSST